MATTVRLHCPESAAPRRAPRRSGYSSYSGYCNGRRLLSKEGQDPCSTHELLLRTVVRDLRCTEVVVPQAPLDDGASVRECVMRECGTANAACSWIPAESLYDGAKQLMGRICRCKGTECERKTREGGRDKERARARERERERETTETWQLLGLGQPLVRFPLIFLFFFSPLVHRWTRAKSRRRNRKGQGTSMTSSPPPPR